ncbi:uncharacterized protein BJX67DRAFT_342681 [Aspergillus lucknowensis]|uniref:Uncharacterized protein n=1 Tax=Aspergillus lucknowensis TaxID=176173 RepID=A0ABR4M4R2_9EURO
MAEGPSIVVGIDFGTTFSGIAWALEGSVDEIEVMSSCPGGGNSESITAAWFIALAHRFLFGRNVPQSPIGYLIRELNNPLGSPGWLPAEAFRGVKLLLDEDQETKYTPSKASKELLAKHGRTAIQVASNYLFCLLEYAENVLRRRLGVSFKDMNLRFMLTVPAVWSDKACHNTLQAAIDAGVRFQDVSLIWEPEAVALYSLRAIQGNNIAVCSWGGYSSVKANSNRKETCLLYDHDLEER